MIVGDCEGNDDDKNDCNHQSVLTDGTSDFIKDQRLRYFSAGNQLK